MKHALMATRGHPSLPFRPRAAKLWLMTDQIGFRQLQLPDGVSGRLYFSSMPGRYRPFNHDLAQAEELGVGTVLCLNPRDEIEWKSPHYHAALNDGSHGWRVIEHPIEDFRAPSRDQHFVDLVGEIAGQLRAGARMMLHCAGGIGRTGTVGACILIALGVPADTALAELRKVRSWPENKAQTDFVHWFGGTNGTAPEAAGGDQAV